MKRKSGFTLVEMLIVVVIIGILSAALIPRLTGYMARTRDLKRHADLRNIAAAITMYKNDHGEFPQRGEIIPSDDAWPYIGSVTGLSGSLMRYLSELPKDPQKHSTIKNMYFHCTKENKKYFNSCSRKEGFALSGYFKDGEYFYYNHFNGLDKERHVELIAKAETPEMANFITDGNDIGLSCGRTWIDRCPHYNLCSSIKKGKTLQQATKKDANCTYTSEDQLYYILKVE